MSNDKKDYILNLRISRATYEKLKDKASKNRETLSNLARNVLDDGLEIMNDLSSDLFGKQKTARDVVYTYEVHLEQDTVCSECGASIKKSKKATIGEMLDGKKRVFCTKCSA